MKANHSLAELHIVLFKVMLSLSFFFCAYMQAAVNDIYFAVTSSLAYVHEQGLL